MVYSSNSNNQRKTGKSSARTSNRSQVKSIPLDTQDQRIRHMGHELRTPLTSMKLYAQLMAKEAQVKQMTNMVMYAQKIVSQIDRLTIRINEFVDLARLDAGTLLENNSSVAFSPLLLNVITTLQQNFPTRSIQLKNTTNAFVQGDEARLHQVIYTIVLNAIEHTPAGKVTIRCLIVNHNLVVEVIEPAQLSGSTQSTLFLRSYIEKGQSDLRRRGLFIAKSIIEAHRGRLTLTNRAKKSIFILTLPIISV